LPKGNGEQKAKLLAQINEPLFEDVIQAAWSDFNDKELFDEEEILLR